MKRSGFDTESLGWSFASVNGFLRDGIERWGREQSMPFLISTASVKFVNAFPCCVCKNTTLRLTRGRLTTCVQAIRPTVYEEFFQDEALRRLSL